MALDTCTTWTIVSDKSMLTNPKPEQGVVMGSTSNKENSGVRITESGKLNGILKYGGRTTEIKIEDAKVAADIAEPLIRAQSLKKMNLVADFDSMKIYNKDTKKVVAKIEEDEYQIPFIWIYLPVEGRTRTTMAEIQHQKQGHLGGGMQKCDDCKQAKTKRKKLIRTEDKKHYAFGEVLSMDTDVMSTRSLEGYLYRQDVIDHGTCWMWGWGVKKRTAAYLEPFLRDILAETKHQTKEFRVDGAKEFRGTMMKTLAKEFQFVLKKTAKHVHEHAGKIEGAHQTVDQMARAMMNTAQLPHDVFWSLAGNAAIYVKNRIPTKGSPENQSPYLARYGVQPDLSKLWVFGCAAYVYQSKEGGRRKMQNTATKKMFVGYPHDGAGYLVMDLKTLKIATEGAVDFDETDFPGKTIDWTVVNREDNDRDYEDDATSDKGSDDDDDGDDDDNNSENMQGNDSEATDEETLNSEEDDASDGGVRRSIRMRTEPDRGMMVSYATTEERAKMNYKQAMASKDRELYRRKIVEYLKDLLDKKAVEVVPRGEQSNLIGSRWVCYRKYVDGQFVKTKVRWTPLGYMQKKGVDYAETFAPVALSATNRLIYVIASKWNRKVRKGDVENAFQRTQNTQHTIFTELCEGMELIYPDIEPSKHMMRLNNAINGTKQSGREFNKKLDEILVTRLKMKRIPGDACLYTSGCEADNTQLMAAFHVDDYQYVGMTDEIEKHFVTKMQQHLPSQVGHVCNEHLGVSITQKTDGSTEFVQTSKIEEYCERFQVTKSTRKLRTMNFNGIESPTMTEPTRYPEILGCINYLVHNSRPDIMSITSLLASYTREPTNANWKGVMDVLTYLNGTKNRALIYRSPRNDEKSLLRIEGYCDASYNSPNENLKTKKTKSRAGYLLFVNGCLIKWYSKVIRLTAQSTEEAEVIAASELVRDVKWLIGILSDLNIPFSKPTIYCDNHNAVNWITTRGVTDRTKHFETKLNLCRESFDDGDFHIEQIPGNENPADLMTKQLCWKKMEKHCTAMGMIERTKLSDQQLGGSVRLS